MRIGTFIFGLLLSAVVVGGDLGSLSHPVSGSSLRRYADSCYAAGDYAEAMAAYRQMLDVGDSLSMEMLREQKVMDRLIAENRRVITMQKYGYIGAAVLVAVLIVIIGYIFYNLERLHQKNRILYEQINSAGQKPPVPDGPEVEAKKDDRLEQLICKVCEGELFKDPAFGRAELASMLGTNETYLYNILKEEKGVTVAGFIADLRLEYAISVMKTRKRVSIEELAIESGFNNARTLQRLFKSKYGMSPSQYLAFCNENN